MGEVLTLRTAAGPLWRRIRKPIAECLAELVCLSWEKGNSRIGRGAAMSLAFGRGRVLSLPVR